MTFNEALATQPAWIQYWVMFMGIVIVGAALLLLVSKPTRRDGLIVVASMALTAVIMNWLYGKVGYVRLLGAVHVAFWTPLVLYLWNRLGDVAIVTPFRQVVWLLMGVLVVSLAFDYVDVARYLLGERDSLVPV